MCLSSKNINAYLKTKMSTTWRECLKDYAVNLGHQVHFFVCIAVLSRTKWLFEYWFSCSKANLKS